MEQQGPNKKRKLLCIVGPTACHKTEAGVYLAKRLNGEILSADSVQVYKGMDIGSAKPSMQEREGVVHHLLDCVPIDTPSFSVAQYRTLATEAIERIASAGHLPIIVGGSGLYLDALLAPLNFALPSNAGVRAELMDEYARDPAAVYARLADIDPDTARRLHVNDGKRVVRALEVWRCGGKTLSSFGNDFSGNQQDAAASPYGVVLIGLHMDRTELYRRIELRVDRMMERGLADEADRLYHAGYSRALPAMQAIGYRQLFAWLDGDCTRDQAIEQIKRDTRNLAKRQLTWFRRDTRIRWFDVTYYCEGVLEEMRRYALERLEENVHHI